MWKLSSEALCALVIFGSLFASAALMRDTTGLVQAVVSQVMAQ